MVNPLVILGICVAVIVVVAAAVIIPLAFVLNWWPGSKQDDKQDLGTEQSVDTNEDVPPTVTEEEEREEDVPPPSPLPLSGIRVLMRDVFDDASETPTYMTNRYRPSCSATDAPGIESSSCGVHWIAFTGDYDLFEIKLVDGIPFASLFTQPLNNSGEALNQFPTPVGNSSLTFRWTFTVPSVGGNRLHSRVHLIRVDGGKSDHIMVSIQEDGISIAEVTNLYNVNEAMQFSGGSDPSISIVFSQTLVVPTDTSITVACTVGVDGSFSITSDELGITRSDLRADMINTGFSHFAMEAIKTDVYVAPLIKNVEVYSTE